MAGLPVLKLAGLLVKTLAKPVASRIKVEASRRPEMSSSIVTLGQTIHQITSRFNVLASGYSFVGVKPLPAEDALSKGVNFISETLIFTVAGTIIVVEYYRGEAKNMEKAKKAAEKEAEDKRILAEKFHSIIERLEDIETALPSRSKEHIELRKEARRLGEALPIPIYIQDKQYSRTKVGSYDNTTPSHLDEAASKDSKKNWLMFFGFR